MRIIGQIPHPYLLISIFRNDQRISVKFENERYEQTYKLGEDDRFSSIEAIHRLVDEQLLEEVISIFTQMHTARLGAVSRQTAGTELPEFDEII